jgi:hypothetical protein
MGLSQCEQEIMEEVKTLGGKATPRDLAREMGISDRYAEQLACDMVWKRLLVKSGFRFELEEW